MELIRNSQSLVTNIQVGKFNTDTSGSITFTITFRISLPHLWHAHMRQGSFSVSHFEHTHTINSVSWWSVRVIVSLADSETDQTLSLSKTVLYYLFQILHFKHMWLSISKDAYCGKTWVWFYRGAMSKYLKPWSQDRFGDFTHFGISRLTL